MFNSYFDVMHFTCLNVLSASCLSTLEGHEAVTLENGAAMPSAKKIVGQCLLHFNLLSRIQAVR